MKITSITKKILSEFIGCVINESFATLSINGKTLNVELARTAHDRVLGLMHRLRLQDDEGMLFVFPKSSQLSFWMKDTRIPLSIAYICKDGNILNIENLEPYNINSKSLFKSTSVQLSVVQILVLY